MGCCTGRCFLITLCVIQLVATIERQVFDFLGYMWAPIIGNFLQIIFVFFGFFATLHYRPKLLVVYSVWSIIWIGWNIFIICFYLEVGILTRDMPILNLGTGNKSWWLDHGIGCEIANQTSSSGTSHNALIQRDVPSEEEVTGCIIQYYYVEVIHAGIQVLFSVIGFCVSCYVVFVFTEEDDSSQPVHDELEYIKMRYRSPARSSFRHSRAYDTLTTRSTYTASTLDRNIDHHYSDDSADRYLGNRGDKKHVLKDNQRRPGFDPVTGQTNLQNPLPLDPAFNISGQTLGMTVV